MTWLNTITFLKKKLVEQRETFQFVSSLASASPLIKSFEKKKKLDSRKEKLSVVRRNFFLKNFSKHSSTSRKKYKKIKKKSIHGSGKS